MSETGLKWKGVDLDEVFLRPKDANLIPGYVDFAKLYSFGINSTGELGQGDRINRSSPVQVGALTNWKYISAAENYSLSLKTDGTLWSWGENSTGALGLSDRYEEADRSSPVQVGTDTNWKNITAGMLQETSVLFGGFSLALKTDGTLWSWGGNTYGTLGHGDTIFRSSPVQVGFDTNWKYIASTAHTTEFPAGHAVATKTNNTLWGWGENTYGQLGQNTTVDRSSPVQIGTETMWAVSACTQDSTAAIKTDGTLWSWGRNNSGQLGQNDTIDRSSPIQIGSLTTWKTIYGGRTFFFATKTDDTLWSWGGNNLGQLGVGDIIDRSSPVQVGTLSDWNIISLGSEFTTVIKHDGTLWVWGSGTLGQLGVNNILRYSSPVQVGSNTNWKHTATALQHTLALSF